MTNEGATIRRHQVELGSLYLHFFYQAMQYRMYNDEDLQDDSGFVLHPLAVQLLQQEGLDDEDWSNYPLYRNPTALQELGRLIPRFLPETTLLIEGAVERFIPLANAHPFYKSIPRPKVELFRRALTRLFIAIACGDLTERELKPTQA